MINQKLKIILNLVSVSHLTMDEYRELAFVLSTHAEYMKQMSPLDKILDTVLSLHIKNTKKEFTLGGKLNFGDDNEYRT